MASPVKARTDRCKRAKHMERENVASVPADRKSPASPSVTVRVPLALKRRGGRKLVVTLHGGPACSPPRPYVDNTVIRALARAHRWKRMFESGNYGSVADLAGAEKINHSYLGRVLRLTLLAPDIAEAILDGRQPRSIQLDRFLRPIPIDWEQQRQEFGDDLGMAKIAATRSLRTNYAREDPPHSETAARSSAASATMAFMNSEQVPQSAMTIPLRD
jgi:hypothetical protein